MRADRMGQVWALDGNGRYDRPGAGLNPSRVARLRIAVRKVRRSQIGWMIGCVSAQFRYGWSQSQRPIVLDGGRVEGGDLLDERMG